MPLLKVVSHEANNEATNRSMQTFENRPVLALKLDANTDIVLSDKPVFGVSVTIKSHLCDYINSIINPGFSIGWVNYQALSKLGCTNDNQYFDAQDYITNDKNQLCFTRPVKLISASTTLQKNKEILRFIVM